MEQKQFKCSGDCLNCRLNPVERKTQWQYCASQFTYNSMKMLEAMQQTLASMVGTVEELKVKIEAIQNSEADVYDPTERKLKSSSETAQSGDGALE